MRKPLTSGCASIYCVWVTEAGRLIAFASHGEVALALRRDWLLICTAELHRGRLSRLHCRSETAILALVHLMVLLLDVA